jgi:hypothetical protein
MNHNVARDRSWDSSVSIGTDYGLDDRDSFSVRGNRFCSPTRGPDRLWDPPSLLLNGWGLGVPIRFKSPRSRMVELYLHDPIHIQGVMLI